MWTQKTLRISWGSPRAPCYKCHQIQCEIDAVCYAGNDIDLSNPIFAVTGPRVNVISTRISPWVNVDVQHDHWKTFSIWRSNYNSIVGLPRDQYKCIRMWYWYTSKLYHLYHASFVNCQEWIHRPFSQMFDDTRWDITGTTPHHWYKYCSWDPDTQVKGILRPKLNVELVKHWRFTSLWMKRMLQFGAPRLI